MMVHIRAVASTVVCPCWDNGGWRFMARAVASRLQARQAMSPIAFITMAPLTPRIASHFARAAWNLALRQSAVYGVDPLVMAFFFSGTYPHLSHCEAERQRRHGHTPRTCAPWSRSAHSLARARLVGASDGSMFFFLECLRRDGE
jgi:hypothetical protein